jgi:hypothetical protein
MMQGRRSPVIDNPFSAPGQFLKGNVHLHTTNSDGRMSPQEALDLYAGAGYDFLAITDHGKVTPTQGLDANGLLLIAGAELHQGRGELGQVHHVVALGIQNGFELPQTDDLGEALAYLRPQARFVFVAHPHWTTLTLADLLPVADFVGVEVYNGTCDHGIGRGYSEYIWDELLVRGRRLFGLAVDDAHCHYPDTLLGWVMVKSPTRTAADVLASLEAGLFYSSNGPTIEDVAFSDGAVTVNCSPCRAVHVVSPGPGRGTTTHHLQSEPGMFCEARLPVSADWNPVRIECVDEAGRKAWTNPFWFD